MDNEVKDTLRTINNNLSQLVSNQEDIKNQLATILMAIYDKDIIVEAPATDTSMIIKGLQKICSLLSDIGYKLPSRNNNAKSK